VTLTRNVLLLFTTIHFYARQKVSKPGEFCRFPASSVAAPLIIKTAMPKKATSASHTLQPVLFAPQPQRVISPVFSTVMKSDARNPFSLQDTQLSTVVSQWQHIAVPTGWAS